MNAVGRDRGEARRPPVSVLDNSGMSIDRLPGLPDLLDRFAADLDEVLEGFFGARPSTTFVDVEATTSFEALGGWVGRSAATAKTRSVDAQVLVAFDMGVVDFLLASAFRSASPSIAPEAAWSSPRQPRTVLERGLVGQFAKMVAGALSASFAASGLDPLDFEDVLTLADALALGRRDIPVAVIRFSVETTAGSNEVNALVPQGLLKPLREKPAAASTSQGAADNDWSRDLGLGLSRARLPITAVLEEFPMTLGDVAKFHVGQVLELRGGESGRVKVDCGGKRVFSSRLLQQDGKYCLEIEGEIMDEAE